jgi:hypothetical protein
MANLTLRRVIATLVSVGALQAVPTLAQAQAVMIIDWANCMQPDLASEAHQKAVKQSIDKYVDHANAKYPSNHIALKLNKIYGSLVQDRRDLVQSNYIPIGPNRKDTQCALSPDNYRKLIVLRDASYYILCRSEVGIGTSAFDRTSKDITTLATAAIYDLVKSLGADLRAKANEPTTPPGGYAACKQGATAGAKDPIPTVAETQGFRSRLSLSAEERAKIGDPSKQ